MDTVKAMLIPLVALAPLVILENMRTVPMEFSEERSQAVVSNVTLIPLPKSLLIWLVSRWTAAGRLTPEETPPTTQNRNAARRRGRPLAPEQKRNAHHRLR